MNNPKAAVMEPQSSAATEPKSGTRTKGRRGAGLGRRSLQGAGEQFVSFHLGNEEYAISITKVREIIVPKDIARLPAAPDHIRGLIDLRNVVIPIIDLHRKFQLDNYCAEEKDKRVMVVDIGERTIGILVDAVNEVLRVGKQDIAPPPPTVAAMAHDYIVGVVQHEGRLLVVLDTERILQQES